MKPDATDIFAKARELTGEEREVFLSRVCGGDAELRLEVQRLFVREEGADSSCADDDGANVVIETPEAPFSGAEGDKIGNYTLRQQIGEGGFGAVWMAEQTGALNRMVALKVVKAGMDTRQVLARFEAERQALAMMDHPHIAKILEAGATPGGRPYFAMELVKGIPITDFCRDQKLGARQRLALFQDVCGAINHAHQKGIIHRDLKPSNVMVTLEAEKPVAKVIDFGIAKATQNKLTDKTLFTRFEQFLGTPVYMSPEQAAMSNLDIDTRSDIYSLGVLLYEILAGSPPFDQKSLLSVGYDEMRRIIKEDEPPKPSVRLTQTQAGEAKPGAKAPQIEASMLKGELDWIVMKAIEKDRTRRYETANAFAADIGRYLENEPVLAAAPSVLYKFRKFVRRNTLALGVGSAFALLLIAAAVVSSKQAWQAIEARNESATSQERAETSLQESEEAREKAENAFTFITETIQSANLNLATGNRELTAVEVLADARRRLEMEFATRPEQRVKLEGALAEAYSSLGKNEEAITLGRRVLDYYDGDPANPEALQAMGGLATAYRRTGREAKALDTADEAYQLAREAFGENDPITLTARLQRAVTRTIVGLPGKETEEPEALVALCRRVHGDNSPEVISSLQMLAEANAESGNNEAAISLMREVLMLRRRALEADSPEIDEALSQLRSYCMKASREGDAILAVEKTLDLFRREFGVGHSDTRKMMYEFAVAYDLAGEGPKAAKLKEKLLAYKRGDHRMRSIPVQYGRGFAIPERERYHEALKFAVFLSYSEDLKRQGEHLDLILSRLPKETNSFDVAGYATSIFLMPKAEGARSDAQKEAWAHFQRIGQLDPVKFKDNPFFRSERGLGAYRVGKLQEVEIALSDDSPAFDRQDINVAAFAVRAMARWKAGNKDAARKDLERAKTEYVNPLAEPADAGWWDYIGIPHVLLREALLLIEGNHDWLPPIPELEPREILSVLVPPISVWHYLHPVDGGDPATADSDFHETWATKAYDDSSWQTGKDRAGPSGGFGYGDEWFTGVDIGLPTVKDAGGRLSGKAAYFRYVFTTNEKFTNLELQCQRDDGIIVYLDGQEVARDNMHAGQADYLIPAIESVSSNPQLALNERTTNIIPLRGVTLLPGEHVLAISVHNTKLPSSDLRIGGITLVEMPEGTWGKKEIDLSGHYTLALDSPRWSLKYPYIDLSRLAQTFTPRHGVTFDLRGAIRLESGKRASGLTVGEFEGLTLKPSIEGIAVNEVTPRIHFLAGSQYTSGLIGERLARIVMHYKDGSTTVMPVVIGPEGVVDWTNPHLPTVVGWKGQIAAKIGRGVLSELIWDNPFPEKMITTIDFVSELSPHGAPFLVAITLE